MTKGRDDVAERMSDLFALIRTRRQSGLLSVERYENGRFEEGEIRFQKGQPVDAHIQNRVGQEALSQLLTWRQVYFLFVPEASNDIPPSASISPVIPQSGTPQSQVPRLPPSNANRPPQSSPSSQSVGDTSSYEQRPQKLVSEQNVMNLSLTRPQRSLYLLVDGRRTVTDLARFTNKEVQEVYRLLSELQARGFITL